MKSKNFLGEEWGEKRENWHTERRVNSKSPDPTEASGIARLVGCSLAAPWRIQTDPEQKPTLTVTRHIL